MMCEFHQIFIHFSENRKCYVFEVDERRVKKGGNFVLEKSENQIEMKVEETMKINRWKYSLTTGENSSVYTHTRRRVEEWKNILERVVKNPLSL